MSDAWASAVFERLSAEREEIRAAHLAGAAGSETVRRLSDAMDRAVRALWERAAPPQGGVALVALGGFGRGELAPHSDVDLMVLHAGHAAAGDASQALFYALWDAGYVVGHATRTPKEALKLARANLEAETSFLEPRMVSGDETLFAEFAEASLRATRKREARFVEDVRAMMAARHSAGGSATSQLEPNIKDGAGGLRDLHVVGWFERVAGDLEGAGLLGEADKAHLLEARELLLRARAHLHWHTGRATDVLLFQHQGPLATTLGYGDAERPAEDAFMRDLFTATRTVEHVVVGLLAELTARNAKPARRPAGDRFAVEAGRVIVVAEPDLAREPERALEVFALGAPLGASALRWLEREAPRLSPEAWTEPMRRTFLRLLRLGSPAVLEAADHADVLGRLIPEWDAVRCQPQHNVYHRFTVDAHLFNTVAAAAALAHDDSDPLVRDVFADLSDPDALLLAALLHDVGKGTDVDHSERGEEVARAILDRMGVSEPRRSTVTWLVRHHLMLVEAATRRDLNDENFVVDVATRLGDQERARLAFLLSVADGRATGPTAWSPWKASLVAELFTKVLHVLERGELVSSDAVGLVRLRTSQLREALTRYASEDVGAHLEGMSRGYFLAFPTTALIRHFALMEEARDGTARALATPTEEPGVYEYALAAPDRPGLFAKVSGVLALNGVNILSAQGFTRRDGLAVEVFRCVGALDPVLDETRWARVTEDVRRALKGRLSLDVRLAEKRKAYARGAAKARRRDPQVIVDNHASDFLTVVEVHAPDRIGLLYDITSTLADLSLDIQVAKIATYADDVVDVFYLRDLDGQKILDPEHVREIERALLLRLSLPSG